MPLEDSVLQRHSPAIMQTRPLSARLDIDLLARLRRLSAREHVPLSVSRRASILYMAVPCSSSAPDAEVLRHDRCG